MLNFSSVFVISNMSTSVLEVHKIGCAFVQLVTGESNVYLHVYKYPVIAKRLEKNIPMVLLHGRQ